MRAHHLAGFGLSLLLAAGAVGCAADTRATDDEGGADTTEADLTSINTADIVTTKTVIASGLGLNRRAAFPGLPPAAGYVATRFHAVTKDDLRADLGFWAAASNAPLKLELLLVDDTLHVIAKRPITVAPKATGGDTALSASFKAPRDGMFAFLVRETSGLRSSTCTSTS
jgi:hypothetical protein